MARFFCCAAFPHPAPHEFSPTVLVFTYPEHGQANVNLATSYELVLAGVNVHVASFPSLRARVSHLQELINRHASRSSGKPTSSVVFHECKGITPYSEAVGQRGVNAANVPHPPGVSGALESYSKLAVALFPWGRAEYLAGIESCKEIIAAIKPNVVVVDTLFHSAADACRLMNQKYMIISPTGIKEAAVSMQPYLAAFWKYPVFSSGFPFPLKWWQIPLNVYLYIRLIILMTTSADVKPIQLLRPSLGLESVFRPNAMTYICPALNEVDFPFVVIPESMLLCGPIVMPFDPLEESDPVLMKWLDNRSTVMINLGSHVCSDDNVTREVASAIRMLLNYHDQRGSSIQVLWKVKASGNIQKVIDEIIGKVVKEGKVKAVAWLDAEPASVLEHPNVVCTVHHGGANSFYEGVWSGVPHIVLPVWYDTYDYAQRAEYLNIGIFANQTCAPSVRAEEFGKALMRVTGDSEEAGELRTAAKHLRELCRAKGVGRELASAAILKEMVRS